MLNQTLCKTNIGDIQFDPRSRNEIPKGLMGLQTIYCNRKIREQVVEALMDTVPEGVATCVEAFDDEGQSVINQQAELVCTTPFSSVPIYFRDDPDGKKCHSAYFDIYPNVWRHGDFIEINDRGGVVIYGRSNATLNPGGIKNRTA